MTPRISGHFSIFGLVFFVLKSLLGIAKQWSREKFAILALKPVRSLVYRTWGIATGEKTWPQLFKRWINHYPVDNAISFPSTYPIEIYPVDNAILLLNNQGQISDSIYPKIVVKKLLQTLITETRLNRKLGSQICQFFIKSCFLFCFSKTRAFVIWTASFRLI